MATIEPVIGIIGGSGLYDIDGLEDMRWRRGRTRPGAMPSDELLYRPARRRALRVPAAPRARPSRCRRRISTIAPTSTR